MQLEQIKSCGDNYSYLVWDEDSLDAVVIDPGFNAERVITTAKGRGLNVRLVIATHYHGDHSSGLRVLKEELGVTVAAHSSSPLEKDLGLEDGQEITVGGLAVRIIHTPGHTADGISIIINGAVFTGDTLFVGECGRTDLPGGDSEALYRSLFCKLLKLPEGTAVYPGHDYGNRPSSTIGEEMRNNYTLVKRTLDEFVAFMKEP